MRFMIMGILLYFVNDSWHLMVLVCGSSQYMNVCVCVFTGVYLQVGRRLADD